MLGASMMVWADVRDRLHATNSIEAGQLPMQDGQMKPKSWMKASTASRSGETGTSTKHLSCDGMAICDPIISSRGAGSAVWHCVQQRQSLPLGCFICHLLAALCQVVKCIMYSGPQL